MLAVLTKPRGPNDPIQDITVRIEREGSIEKLHGLCSGRMIVGYAHLNASALRTECATITDESVNAIEGLVAVDLFYDVLEAMFTKVAKMRSSAAATEQ